MRPAHSSLDAMAAPLTWNPQGPISYSQRSYNGWGWMDGWGVPQKAFPQTGFVICGIQVHLYGTLCARTLARGAWESLVASQAPPARPGAPRPDGGRRSQKAPRKRPLRRACAAPGLCSFLLQHRVTEVAPTESCTAGRGVHRNAIKFTAKAISGSQLRNKPSLLQHISRGAVDSDPGTRSW